jgi:TPR repeat protein
MYNSGKGVPRDDAEAMKLWRKAAEQGLAAAKSLLDKMKDK